MATAASKAQGMTSSNGIRRCSAQAPSASVVRESQERAGKLVRRATLDLAFTPGRTSNGKVDRRRTSSNIRALMGLAGSSVPKTML